MNYIIPVITGAIIGYLTNWLAIKMLFRPLEEKRILGIKIPFTPGLIPKERDRIARSVGKTVGEHLLSTEVLSQALYSPRIINYIRDFLHNKLTLYCQASYTIDDCIRMICVNDFSKVEKTVREFLADRLSIIMRNPHNRKKLINKITALITEEPVQMTSESRQFKQLIASGIKEYMETSEFREYIVSLSEKILSGTQNKDKTILQVLPKSVTEEIQKYIYSHEEQLTHKLREDLASLPVRGRLKSAIASMLEQNLGRLITMFASIDSISEKILNGIDDYLSKTENYREVSDTILMLIQQLGETKLSSIAENLSSKQGRACIEVLSETAITTLWDNAEAKETESSLVKDKRLSQGLENILIKLSDSVCQEGYINKLAYIITDKVMTAVGNKKLSAIIDNLSSDAENHILYGIERAYKAFAMKKAPQMIDALNIPRIVEDEINGFDIKYGEKLITDIAQRELSAITWIGALLGAVMGIVIPLLERLL